MNGKALHVQDREVTTWDPDIAELVEPIAAYICAADDPAQAIVIIAVHLGIEISGIRRDARALLLTFDKACRDHEHRESGSSESTFVRPASAPTSNGRSGNKD
jgi:hypothetical protein